MSHKYGTQLLPGFHHYGNGGLGLPVASIPQTGEVGGSYLANEAADPANAGKEIRGLILTYPSAGVFTAEEDGSFTFTSAPNGQYTFTYQSHLDGADGGIGTGTIVVGGLSVSGNAVISDYVLSGTIFIPATAGTGVVLGNTNVFGANMKKNTAGQTVGVQMTYLNGNDFIGAVTAYITGDNASQSIGTVGSGLCTSKGNGYYTYSPSQAETNYNQIGFTYKGVGAATVTKEVYTSFPQTSDAPTSTQIADATLNRDMAAVSETNTRSLLNAVRFIRNKWVNTGTTLTVFKEDDTTPAWTAVIASTPGADPVSGVDPV